MSTGTAADTSALRTALEAIDAMKVPASEDHKPAEDWISVGVVRSILAGTHPILARLAQDRSPDGVA